MLMWQRNVETMTVLQLPDRVVKSWGSDVAQDFVEWLDTRLHTAQAPQGVQISALTARQQVNVLMLEQVSNLLLADEPWLVQTATGWAWRVPVDLTYPGRGRVGRVGLIDVDANLGLVQYAQETLQEILREAEMLANQHQVTDP
jgi:hypothetical protein